MGRPAVLKVDIVADAKGVGKGVDDADRKLSSLGGGAKKVGLAIGAGLAVGAVAAGAFAKSAVTAASDVEQSFGAVESVFGKAAGQVKAYADQAAVSVGLSKADYASLAAVVGSQLQGMGVEQDKSAAKTNDLIKVGADLAATFGGSVSDAVGAVGSLLRGERDPIEKYGVSITAADVAARLAAQGQDKLQGAALKTAQAQATLALLTDKTKNATGAFGRESDTLAGQQARLGAQFDNVKAAVGARLLPALTDLLGFVGTTVLPRLKDVGGFLQANLAPAFDFVSKAVGVVKVALFGGGSEMNEFSGKLRTVNNASLVVRDAFSAVSAFITGKLIPAVVAVAGPALGGLKSAFAAVGGAVVSNRDQLGQIFAVLGKVLGVALKLAPVVGTVLAGAFRVVGAVMAGVITTIGQVVRAVEAAMSAIGRLADAARSVGSVVGALNPFGGPPLAVGSPTLVGGTDLAPRSGGLATAALGSSGASLLGAQAALRPVVLQRSTTVHVTVNGALDPVGVARQIRQLLGADLVRSGAVPAGAVL